MDYTKIADRITQGIEEIGSRAGRELDEQAQAAQRALRHARESVGDLEDEAIHQVKRHPAAALAIAFGVGAALALILRSLMRDRNA
jgi:ElaB/YqjD/DUF883 family membrane-anchored ribosome-binding protein